MRGSAMVRGIDATGVSALAGRTGAACGAGEESVMSGSVAGGADAQPAIQRRRRGERTKRRRMDLRNSKKNAPAEIRGGESLLRGQEDYGRMRRMTTRRLRRRPSAVALSPTGSEVPRPS